MAAPGVRRAKAALRAPDELLPVRELVFVHLEIDFLDTEAHSLLHISYGLVVDRRSDLLEEEAKQSGSRDVADLFVHVLEQVAFDRRDRLLADVFWAARSSTRSASGPRACGRKKTDADIERARAGRWRLTDTRRDRHEGAGKTRRRAMQFVQNVLGPQPRDP
jgi:hypothetical protein